MKKRLIVGTVIVLLVLLVLYVLNGLGTVTGQLIVKHTDKASWQIEYKLDKSVIGIMTGPETKKYHESSWDLPEDFHFVKDASGYSWLEKKDKSAFKDLTVHIKTYDEMVLYAPQPFANFDFGVSINSGPLGFVTKVKLLGLFEMMHAFKLKYAFKGLENETVIVPNTNKTEDVSIEIPGSFVFFGAKENIVETEDIQLILDSDFPVELRDSVLKDIEKITAFYNKRIGKVLDNKLMVQITYKQDSTKEGEYFSIGGGAQNGQFSGIAKGPVSITDVKDVNDRLRKFMAHEIAHIWQPSLGMDKVRWVIEGGAEILSHLGVSLIGLSDPKEFKIFLNNNIAKSIKDLKKTSLEQPHVNGFQQLNYDAGSIVLWAACKATDADGKADDIYDMTRELRKISKDSLAKLPNECLHKVFRKLGIKEKVIKKIDHFIVTKHEDPKQAFKELFDITGLPYEEQGDRLVLK